MTNLKNLKNHARLILRGLKILMAFPKPVLPAKTAYAVFNAGVPFINLWFSARILNELAGNREPARLFTLVLLTVGLNLLFSLIRSLLSRWRDFCISSTWSSYYQVYGDKLLSMDYNDIENPAIQQAADTIHQHQSGMGFGLPNLSTYFDGAVTGFIQIALSVALAFSLFSLKVPAGSAFAYLDSPWMVLGVLLMLAASVLLAPYLFTMGTKALAKLSETNNKGNRLFVFYFFDMTENSGPAKDIRIYNQKNLVRYEDLLGGVLKLFAEFTKSNARFSAAGTAVTYLSNGLIYLFVAVKALAGAFGVGSIVQYVGAITQFGNGISAVLSAMGMMINNNAFLEKSLEFLDIPNQKYQGTLSVEKRDDNEYEIEFKNVSFKYPGTETYALRNLDMKFNIGCRLAVVGMNGSGKTTMIKLLCRLYDPTEGVITLNGLDIRKYNYDEYMALFGVVFQDFKLLPFTLGQNVAANMTVDTAKATRALADSGFKAKLDALPKGLETCLYKNFEEEGVEISGGEAQKIALARALYKNAPFIVLDEPTAALDPVAEYEIYTKFNEIVGDKTAVYISHRLSSCRFCDDIAVFHEGRLIQRGSHDRLLAEGDGKYRELWMAQAQYYQTEKPEECP